MNHSCICAEYFDAYIGGESSAPHRFSVGDRILWADAFGIGGILYAARIVAMSRWSDDTFLRGLAIVQLDIEPGDVVRQVVEHIRDQVRRPFAWDWPTAMNGDGGNAFIVGDMFARDIRTGKIRPAAVDDAGRAKDAAELTKMPDWWESGGEPEKEES